MKLFVLSLFSVTLIAASEVEKAVPDVVTDESGYRSRLSETNNKGLSGRGYSGQEVYSQRLDNKQRRYPELGERGYEVPVPILNSREYNPISEEVVFGYGSDKGRGGYNSEYLEGYPEHYGHGEGYMKRFPDYKYRTYGREGLGFDQRTAYALGLRYPLTPQLLQTLYRRKYPEETQNFMGKTVQA